MDRALARIKDSDRKIKTHKEATIVPLEMDLQAMEAEEKMRAALLGKTGRCQGTGSRRGMRQVLIPLLWRDVSFHDGDFSGRKDQLTVGRWKGFLD